MKINFLKRKPDVTKIIFIVYCLILVWIVLFKISFSFSDVLLLKGTRTVNLIPFYYDRDVGRFHLKEVLMNGVVFIPLGIYLKMLNVSTQRTVIYGGILSLSFEICQFAFAIGASDITDIISNALGSFAGVCLYLLLSKIFSNKRKTDRVINITASVLLLLFFTLCAILIIAN